MDYSVFDSLLDSIFVIDGDKKIEYCNETAATLCQSSVRRLTKGKLIYEVFQLGDADIFVSKEGEKGRDDSLPFTEVTFELIKSEKNGKIQVATQPFMDGEEPRWVILIRDVTLEEVLYGKYRKELEGKERLIEELKEAHSKLEVYSKGLEKMVEERTVELNSANRTLKAIMNSLGQGFLVFDKSGVCGNVYTKICEDVLESTPAGLHIADVLKSEGAERTTLSSWMEASFSEALPFESMKDLGPSNYSHSKGKHVTLDYYALRDNSEKIENIVMVATDKTDEVKANEALERERSFAKMILKMVAAKDQFARFLLGSRETLGLIEERANVDVKDFDHSHIYRILHTLEGEAGTYSALRLVKALKNCQQVMEPLKTGWADDPKKILVDFRASVKSLKNEFHEFKNEHSHLLELIGVGSPQTIEIDRNKVQEILAKLNRAGVERDLVIMVEDKLLRRPVSEALKHYQETVNTVCTETGKKLLPIAFDHLSEAVFLDQYEGFFSSMVHVFRNAVDHGIEPRGERLEKGKPEEGKIELNSQFFRHDGVEWLRIIVKDDGGGINAEAIRSKLKVSQPNRDWDSLPDHEIIQNIFESGISSKTEIGKFSGRGVGMDAVRHEVEILGGRIWVESQIGKGTVLTIEIPDIRPDTQIYVAA